MIVVTKKVVKVITGPIPDDCYNLDDTYSHRLAEECSSAAYLNTCLYREGAFG